MDFLDCDEIPSFTILGDDGRGKIKQKPKPLQCKFRVGDLVQLRVEGAEKEGPYKIETVDTANKKYTLCDSAGYTAKEGRKWGETDLVAA
ncbi:uncharacterized protein LY89DRAFT_689876 [Mollisia scopiformis]|uniref:Uncharacterized protein n=1 Tax=Mollisia scopiformis TaxID=149040 RepID=A0A132BCA4_MOLSC|nr:uncharacterized protein LY89DRAFT_689876 [Mollisia scopiformis]KUJ10001.1 hypothetical protein LY89DRAFT_689876 [Mollisia scopiformis]